MGKQKRDKLRYEVHLTEHCNLNCKGCFHFSNIAEEEYLQLEEYTRDVAKLGELYNGEAEQILLMGGEPLLHPEINNFIEVTRKYFPIGEIAIVTNGLLLLNMKKEFWKCCAQNEIIIRPTKYPINIDYNLIEKTAKDENVKLVYFNDGSIEKTLSVLSIDDTGRQNVEKNFYSCYRGNGCITLEHGRLYSCIMPAHLRHYKKFFSVAMKDFTEDGINIYQVKTADEINEFLTKPISACAYCNMKQWRTGEKWEKTSKMKTEWL